VGKHPSSSTYLCLFGERKKILRMRNWKLQINLKIIEDELEEKTTPEISGFPTTSPLPIEEPLIS